jgi:hypothetical protein
MCNILKSLDLHNIGKCYKIGVYGVNVHLHSLWILVVNVFRNYVSFEWFCYWSNYFNKGLIDFVLVLILEWLCFCSHYFSKV